MQHKSHAADSAPPARRPPSTPRTGPPLPPHDPTPTLPPPPPPARSTPRRFLVGLRAFGDDSSISIDLCNKESEFVAITKDGWEITQKPGIIFRSTRGQPPLPPPDRQAPSASLTPGLLASLTPSAMHWLRSASPPTAPHPTAIF